MRKEYHIRCPKCNDLVLAVYVDWLTPQRLKERKCKCGNEFVTNIGSSHCLTYDVKPWFLSEKGKFRRSDET